MEPLILLILVSGLAFVCIYFAAHYLAKTLAGKQHKIWHTMIVAVLGYITVGMIVLVSFKGFN